MELLMSKNCVGESDYDDPTDGLKAKIQLGGSE